MAVLAMCVAACGDTAGSDPMGPQFDAAVMESDAMDLVSDARLSTDGVITDSGGPMPTIDVGVDGDAGLEADMMLITPDGGTPPADGVMPTWVDCHLASRDDEMTPDLQSACDAMHAEPPPQRLYGIRFVFLADVGDVMDWIEPRLAAANRIFEPAGVQFTTAAIIAIPDDEVEYLTGRQSLPLASRLQGLRGHLELPDAGLDVLLDDLQDRLLRSGADPEVVASLSGDSEFTDQLFMRLMARAHPEDIYVAIGTVSERQGAGGQAPPPFHPIVTLERSVVSVKESTKNTVMAHELGHYFGLKHPHSQSAGGANAHLFAFRRVEQSYRASETHELMEVIDEQFGAGLDAPLGTPFVPYDATAAEIADFEALRFALMDTWVRWRVTHAGDLQPYDSYAQFIEAWRRGDAIALSNYMFMEGQRTLNNCTWQADDGAFRCTYPERDAPLTGEDPLLDGYVLFNEGTQANVMSYIRIQNRNAPPTNFGLFEEQFDVIKVSANAPQRLALRNYALELDESP